MKSRVPSILSITFLTGALFTFTFCGDSIYIENEPDIQPLSKSWEKVIPNQKLPDGIVSLSAKQCGVCHQDHYKEWSQSTHAHAWTDLQFQSEIKKESSPFMCINCHIPLQNQQEYIIEGLIDGDIYRPVKKKNPNFDRELQLEGINCATCHVRNGAVIGPTGTTKAPHKTIKDTEFLSESLCISCHNAVAVVTPTLACSFETGDEWESGPYFGKENCIDCHMTAVNREVMKGMGKRPSRIHNFAGSGIPKFDTVATNMKNGLEFYPTLSQKIISLSDSIFFTLKVKNEHAGHKVPTGDPERFFLITFELKNEKNEIIATTTDRIGEKWQWYPVVKKLSDNNLGPNEERLYSFTQKSIERGNYELSVKVTKHRMTNKSAEYNGLRSNYPTFITIYDDTFKIGVN